MDRVLSRLVIFKKIGGLGAILLFGVILLMSINARSVSATGHCSSSAAAQNGISVVPSHGSAFYIDTSVTPVLDAGYVGYRVTNNTGSTSSNLWTEVSSFTGGKVTLSNALDSAMQLPSLTNGSTGTSYFMLKGTAATNSAQTHTVRVYNGRPDLAGSTALYSCNFSFSKVQETQKAAANKVANNGLTSSAAIEVSDSSPELGQLITITVEGQTGNIGAGSAPDNDMIWLVPAAVSSWPTRALRLESVSVTFDGNGNWTGTGDQVTYSNQLLISSANGLTNVDSSEYRISYGFRVIGQPSGTIRAVPVAQISSGSQIKHADTSATGATLEITFATLAINAALTKTITSTTGLATVDCSGACVVPGGAGNGTYVEVPYRLTATTSTSTTQTIDEFVDQPATSVIFKPGSATVTDIGRTNTVIADPVTITTDSAPKPIHFIGPFAFSSATSATINYIMYVPVGSFANTAYAKIGDYLIGATSSAMSRITITSTGTGTVEVVSETVGFGVVVETDPATSITSSGAVMNGTVDPNGTATLTGQFEYGTSATLVGSTTVTATTPASGTLNGLTAPTSVAYTLSGLSSGTTYYYRVIAGSTQGSILSFTTIAVLASPTTTTTAATSVAVTSGTLNGTINPNLTSITGIQFIYGTVSNLSSGTTTTTIDDGSGLAALTATGSSEQSFSQSVTGLTTSTTYYFKIRACTSALTGTYPNVSCSSFVDGSILNFVPALISRTITIDSSSFIANYLFSGVPPTLTSTSSAGAGSKSYSSSTTGVCTVNSSTGAVAFVAVGVCTIGVSIASDGEYIAATSSNISFDITLVLLTSRTLEIDSASHTSTYTTTTTPPTIASIASIGVGEKTFSSSTTGVCTIDSSSGLVAFISAGTCTIGASIASDGAYAIATASTISFSVTLSTRTLEIDSLTFASTYTMADSEPTIDSIPSIGAGTKSFSSLTTGVCTINSSSGLVDFVSAGTCTIGASITADGFYNVATASTVSFAVTLASRSLTIDSDSHTSTYTTTTTPPTIASIASIGVGEKTFSSSTTGVCTINASSGLVAFVSAGTCTIGASIAADGTYDVATASTVSFVVATTSGGGGGGRKTSHKVPAPVALPVKSTTSKVSVSTPVSTTSAPASVPASAPAPVPAPAPAPAPVPAISASIVTCTASCSDMSYDLYIVNPDGSERHMGSNYVKTTTLPDGKVKVAFEDKGTDFDYNDVIILIDTQDCSAVSFQILAVNAGWRHQVRVSVSYKGQSKFTTLLWSDTHVNANAVQTINAKNNPSMCVRASAVVVTPTLPVPVCTLITPFTRNLALRSSGDSVLLLQNLLKCLGYFPAITQSNGIFGKITLDSVIALQKKNGIPAIGLVGPITRAFLNTYLR